MTDQWQRRQSALAPARPAFEEFVRWLPIVAYALFLTSAAFKTDERLFPVPFDLTLGMAIVTVGYVVWRLVAERTHVPKEVIWIVVLFAAFAIPEFTAGPATPYGLEKVTNLFTLTLLAAIAPFFVIRTRRDARDFYRVIGVLALIISFDMVLQVLAGELGRLTGFAGSPIWSGRMAGIGLTLAITAVMTRSVKAFPGAIVVAITSVALISSGTRGAFVGAAAAVLVAYPVTRIASRKATGLLGVIFVIAVAFVASFTFSEEGNFSRFQALTSGDIGSGGDFRLEAFDTSLREISHTQSGIGWGGYGKLRGVFDEDGAYPHNLVLEVAVEAGWIPAGIMIFITGGIFAIAVREGPKRPESIFALALLTFTLVAAMFSGDINGNRLFFAMLGLVLALTQVNAADRWQGYPV